MSIYSYQDYKKYVNEWVMAQPRRGHGQLRKMAECLRVSSVIMSQVFRGDRELSSEQAVGVAQFLSLNESERNYFLLLVQIARAGTADLKAIYRKQLEDLRNQSLALKNRIKHQKMTNEDRATFYSHWYYSAIRLGVSIQSLNSASTVADYLQLDRKLVASVIEFLVHSGLVVEKNGRFELGPPVTHVGHDSKFVSHHHANWRIQGLQRLDSQSDHDLFYTGPMALSQRAAQEIRELLVEIIEKATDKVANSKSETLRCLNIDWFKVQR